MQKTVEQDGIKITLHLKADESVDLTKKMKVEHPKDFPYDMSDQTEPYPSCSEHNPNVGFIEDQFALVKASMRFEEVYQSKIAES